MGKVLDIFKKFTQMRVNPESAHVIEDTAMEAENIIKRTKAPKLSLKQQIKNELDSANLAYKAAPKSTKAKKLKAEADLVSHKQRIEQTYRTHVKNNQRSNVIGGLGLVGAAVVGKNMLDKRVPDPYST